jgi:hypothetical protein
MEYKMNLAEKMSRWADLKAEADKIEFEIEQEVRALKKPQSLATPVGQVKANYSKGRGTYDYPSLALKLNPPKRVIEEYSQWVTDWKKVCDFVGFTAELKAQFYTEGNPAFSLKLIPLEEEKTN